MTLSIGLLDHRGQIVASNNVDEGELVPKDPSVTTVTGTTKVTATNGVFVFDNFQIISEPGSNTAITVASSAIDPGKSDKA